MKLILEFFEGCMVGALAAVLARLAAPAAGAVYDFVARNV
jgi:hypothetical protein